MKTKRLLSVALATMLASTAAASINVSAYAENGMLTLMTGRVSDEMSPQAIFSDGIISYKNSGNWNVDIDGFIHIGDDEIAEWRKTDTFNYTVLKSDIDLSVTSPKHTTEMYGNSDTYYFLISETTDPYGFKIDNYATVRLDEENDKLTTIYENKGDWSYITDDGYTFYGTRTDNELIVNIADASGKMIEDKIALDETTEYIDVAVEHNKNSKYVGYVMLRTDITTDEFGFRYGKLVIYGYDRNGNASVLSTQDGVYGCGIYSDSDSLYWYYETSVGVYAKSEKYFYSSDADAIIEAPDYDGWKVYCIGTYGDISIVEHQTSDARMAHSLWNNKTNKVIATYKEVSMGVSSISTYDGEIFLVNTESGKWGYINRSGDLLATFDDATRFFGEYAAVVSNGEGYLIDRNMNRVSDTIYATGCYASSDDLFVFGDDSGIIFATYDGEVADDDVATDEAGDDIVTDEAGDDIVTDEAGDDIVTDEAGDDIVTDEAGDDIVTDEAGDDIVPDDTTNDSEKGKSSPETGIEGVAGIGGITLIAGLTLLLSRKKK